MIARFHRVALLVAAIVSVAAAACEKVPLLAPSGSTITLTAAATALPFNGTAQIIAQVIEPSGTPPHSGTHVSFTTTLGSVQPSDATTDIDGRAVVTFNAGTSSGTATITAISGGAAATGGANQVKIAVGAAAVGGLAISANPGTVSASGGSSTITASVRDTNGNALAGVPVTFTTTAGALSSASVNTDSSGNAQTTLTTNKQADVTASAGVASGTGTTATAAQTAKVTVGVNTTAAITVTATPSAPTAGQTVSFAISQATGGSPIQRSTVDFGDGSVQSFSGLPSAVTHTYSSAGTFLMRITASDTFGDAVTGTAAVTVTPKPQPTVTLSASGSPTVGTVTTFTIGATASTGNAITSVRVDFGDGQSVSLSGNSTSVQHIYQTAGTYTVTAIATDSSGSSGSASTVIVVSGAAVASFTTANGAAGSKIVNFDASASTAPGTITSYSWNFGDGTQGTGLTTQRIYTTAGPFTVTLTITDNAGHTATTSKSVTPP